MRLRRICNPKIKPLRKQASDSLYFGSAHLLSNAQFPVPMRPGETPVPIPNTTVKTRAADGTALETMWESRRAPEQKKSISRTTENTVLRVPETSGVMLINTGYFTGDQSAYEDP